LAAIAEHKDMVELLLANKADVNAKDKSGMTPLSWVLAQKDMVVLLRQHGGHE
jgi:ankyrin repeat protein